MRVWARVTSAVLSCASLMAIRVLVGRISAAAGMGRRRVRKELAASVTAMFHKVLVANRGEIAVRAFRAAFELGLRTVAVFPYEDRNADHRVKAHESYLIGEEGHPVRAYLDIDEIIRAAKEAGADAIYPGYGFLSENPDLAAACEANGITFIGPSAEVLTMAGNKVSAIEQARKAGVPTLASCPPSTDPETLIAAAREIGFPVFIKAVAGGGGRGMRRVDDPAQFADDLCRNPGQFPPVIRAELAAGHRLTREDADAASFAPISANAIRESCCPVILFNPRRTAAASEEPPPMPASDGICFTSSMWTPPENPVSLKNNSAASHMRFAFPPGASPSLMEREIPPASVSVTSSQRDILCITLSIS